VVLTKFHKLSSICWPTKVIDIPEDLKYFHFRATFDFECYFKHESHHPRNTEKLTWEAEHVPLSVSVFSNIPGYDEHKCFVSSGDTREMIQKFVETQSLLITTTRNLPFHSVRNRHHRGTVRVLAERMGRK
jgi:hypothetical protein